MKPMRKCLKPVFSGLTSRGRLHWLQEEAPPPTLHPVDKHPNMAPAGETRGVETEAHKPTGDDDDGGFLQLTVCIRAATGARRWTSAR
ncbi:Hypothetical protein SMAX5B_000190 [Scophthalmus maximus]|uniref:Uncharacterized protein n=1 Tax=Scophthalmus maximus TaxID=52904 RepID=A0A2U9CUN3_SCOMX|nr:Hypothetical protein SMAX5B_000190 [Scophthalmus maximus]